MEKNLNKCFICFKGACDRAEGYAAGTRRAHGVWLGVEEGPAPSSASPLWQLPCRKNPC